MTHRWLRCVLVVILMTAGLATATGNLWIRDHQSLQHQLEAMRAFHGLTAIPESGELTDLATEHSWSMARAGTIFHSTDAKLRSTPGPWVEVGQVVGAAEQPWQVIRAFMDSPPHRAVLLGDWRDVGFGHIRDGERVYVTLWFRR